MNETLSIMQEDNPHSVTKRCNAMLSKWLAADNTSASWQKLFTIIDNCAYQTLNNTTNQDDDTGNFISIAFILHSASLISACHAADGSLPQLVPDPRPSTANVFATDVPLGPCKYGRPWLPQMIRPCHKWPHCIFIPTCSKCYLAVHGRKSYVIVCIGCVMCWLIISLTDSASLSLHYHLIVYWRKFMLVLWLAGILR